MYTDMNLRAANNQGDVNLAYQLLPISLAGKLYK